MKLDEKGPTSRWWSIIPSLCGTMVNIKGPSYMTPGVHFQRRTSTKISKDWPGSAACSWDFHGIGPDLFLPSSRHTAVDGEVDPLESPCWDNLHVRQRLRLCGQLDAATYIPWLIQWQGEHPYTWTATRYQQRPKRSPFCAAYLRTWTSKQKTTKESTS